MSSSFAPAALGKSAISQPSLVIAATFTAEPLASPLAAWCRWLELSVHVRFAAYNQIFQQLLDPHSLLWANRDGTNVLLIRLADWRTGQPATKADQTAQHAQQFVHALGRLAAESNGRLIVCFCPNPSTASLETKAALDARETELTTQLSELARVHVIASTAATELYPVSQVEDPLANQAGHVPYTQAYFTGLATLLARRLYTAQRLPAKVIALDCDNTLWDGVCGEVGPRGVVVSQPHRMMQQQLLQLREQGFLLCLCSKNNAADAWEVFDQHPDMLLRREHITAARLNWSPKSQNLRELAEQLNLGLDSFVFIDDSPLECAEVRAHLPQVLTLQLPIADRMSGSDPANSPGDMGSFLQHVWALDRARVTFEDRQRAEAYAQEVLRGEVRQQAVSLEQFLAELNLQLRFVPLDDENLERASQLTQRTNQFNFTTRRRTVEELKQWSLHPQHHAFLVDASDKFGQYGLVGLALYRVSGDTLQVDTLLLSCRALGRRIEYRMLAELSRCAASFACVQVEVQLIETEKNQPAQDLLRHILGDFRDKSYAHWEESASEQAAVFRMSVAQLDAALGAAERMTADSQARAEKEPPADRQLATVTDDDMVSSPTKALAKYGAVSAGNAWPVDLCQLIATDWNNVESIRRRLRAEARPRPELENAFVPARSAIERAVVALCQDVLGLQRVGIDDELKALGASSLHIVQLYSGLEQIFHAGLSITDLFALPTVSAIIDKIELNGAEAMPRDQSSSDRVRTATVSESGRNLGIAVIGMAGRFPGAANVREFWANITHGVCSIVDIAEQDLNLPHDSPLRRNPNLVRRAASVDDADKFDAKFFGIFPKEAAVMDPQHRLLLENCWHAIEDAGYNVDAIDVPVGVFAGCYMDTYMLASLAVSPRWIESLANAFHGGDLLTELGNDKDYLATRVAFLLNLRGPAITVQTACSTSLVAIAQACQSLLSGQCEMALAGGSTLKLPQNRGYLYTEGGMVSPDGVCRAFDARAQGTVFGEGCGVVLLKRVEQAVADGDDIYAVIKGWGLNNDGRAKLGYTAPSVEGQAGAIAMAHRAAGINADSITLVEAHGTGTSLGDPIEIESLTRVFRQSTDRRQYCAIGSLKTNIGHLDVAAGVAGLIKASLALRHRVLPPSLHYEQPNPNIDFEASPFFVNTHLQPWEAPFPRRAGLSSFGVGGTNAHLVLEEAPLPMPTAVASAPQADAGPLAEPQLLLLSARSNAALDQQRLALLEHLQAHPQIDLADVAYTLQTGRKTFNYTLATVVRGHDRAIAALRDKPAQQLFEQRQVRRGKSVVFMFPGQGSQHVGMAADLYQSDPVFRSTFDDCRGLLRASLGFDLSQRIFSEQALNAGDAAQQLNQTAVAQAAIFSVSYALAKRLEVAGVTASRMIGHSVGEFVAACLAGVFSLPDALRLIVFRATHMQQLPGGSMLAVRLSEAEVLSNLPSELALAAINGPQLCVVAGPTEVVRNFQTQLEAQEVVCRSLYTSHAFHSSMMDAVVAPFEEQLRGVTMRPPKIPIVSSVTGQPLSDAQAVDPGYWARHLRETVRFTDTLATITADSDAVLLEVGPGQTLSTLARQHPQRDAEQAVLSSLPHAQQHTSATEHLLLAIGRLWQAGVNVDWKAQFQKQQRRRLHLPGYPFERLRYWLEPDPEPSPAAEQAFCAQPVSHTKRVFHREQVLHTEQLVCPEQSSSVSAEANSSVGVSADEHGTTPQPAHCPALPLPVHSSISTTAAETDLSKDTEFDEMTRRVIQQQLHVMQQQLRTWRS